MASPKTATERYNATHDWAGGAVFAQILDHYPRDAEILDVGAGWGKYRDLLPSYSRMDAVEVHEPYVDAERLRERYRDVFVGDVYTLVNALDSYAAVIFGDVLEHLPLSRARVVINTFTLHGSDVYVVVPYLHPQDAVDGVEHERHLQDDLTPENMIERYPNLRLLGTETRGNEPFKGLYTNRKRRTT